MVITAKDGVFEQFDKTMPKSYWMRNKKQHVNLLYDSPFAIERQLEDQRISSERNRNPQGYNPTKVDRVRSEKIIQKSGASRAVAVKANVLNKIVREASGVHNYTIVAPPREIAPLTKADLENDDPETNPKMKPYAIEAKQKPTLCSFGHRPSSASRTFHPATMKFRLKHGEIAGDNKKTGFGLPVAILQQVLRAPKIYLPGSSELLSERSSKNNSKPGSPGSPKNNISQSELNGLFFTPEEQDDLLYNNNGNSVNKSTKGRRSVRLEEDASQSQATWVSSQEKRAAAGKNKKLLKPIESSVLTGNSTTLGPNPSGTAATGGIDRPEWDSAHHRIKVEPNAVFSMRVSGLNDLAQVPLSEKLQRFAKLAVAESQFVPFCTEKQKTDKIIQSGVQHKVPKAVPLKGHTLYYDPWDVELNEVKRHRKETERKERERLAAKKYQDNLSVVPDVNYYPTTKLHKIKVKDMRIDGLSPSNRPSRQGAVGAGNSLFESSTIASEEQVKLEGSSSSIQKPHTLLSFAYPMSLNKLQADSNELLQSTDDFNNVNNHTMKSKFDYSTANRFSKSLPALDGPEWISMEVDSKKAMKAAKHGDTRALYDYSMKDKVKSPKSKRKSQAINASSVMTENSLALSDSVKFEESLLENSEVIEE